MTKTGLISVVVPVYNRESSIYNAVQSVMSQTFTSFELLLIDDCSTDNSWDVIQNFNDPRIKCFKLSKNSGPAVARNYGIKKSEGEYISLLDSDDFYEPEFLENSYNLLRNSSKEVGFMWTGVRYIDENSNKEFSWVPQRLETPYLTFLNSLHIGTNSGISFKREVFDTCGYFNEKLPAAEDTEFFLRTVQEFDYTYSKEILINIRKAGSDRLSKNYKKIGEAYNIFLKQHFSVIDNNMQLKQRYYYKMMWLNYHLSDITAARFYYNKIPKSMRNAKIKIVRLAYEFLPLKTASYMHQKLSS
ncbi:glycosyltransferase family 2 protein [Salinimicrobium xinjiangense]|uniref:glycosyltransferase family 2 protein n=1 Tax=Salinimicrobium xinjiangense TaxID=438596 RepID=UPI000407B5C1|nr:glycosyltransferase family 2 protein [Salinimicrobium xinjiangense]